MRPIVPLIACLPNPQRLGAKLPPFRVFQIAKIMFWRRKSKVIATERRHYIPAGRRVYAIGDIHGRDDLFGRLVAQIRADHAARPPAAMTLILLGDLVDRGADSSRVIDRAMQLREELDDVRLLIGNHEECFLAALTGDVRKLRYFYRIGGDATIRSYWGNPDDFESASFEELAEALPNLVPAEHVAFLGGGEDVIEVGDYVFVHAGIRPGVPLEKQSLSDLRWIREEFLDDLSDHGKMIVHGHTISAEPEERANRIGLDLGAFRSGTLAAMGLEGDSRWFIIASEGDVN